jgi:hypothetical protein
MRLTTIFILSILLASSVLSQTEINRFAVEVNSIFPKKSNDIVVPTLGGHLGFRYGKLVTEDLIASFGVGIGVSSGHIDFWMDTENTFWENLFVKSLYASADIRIGFYLDKKRSFLLFPGVGLESVISNFQSGRRYFLDENSQVIAQAEHTEWISNQELLGVLSLLLIHQFQINGVDLYFGPFYQYGELTERERETSISASKFGLAVGCSW